MNDISRHDEIKASLLTLGILEIKDFETHLRVVREALPGFIYQEGRDIAKDILIVFSKQGEQSRSRPSSPRAYLQNSERPSEFLT